MGDLQFAIEKENTKFKKLKYFSDANFNGFMHEFAKISKAIDLKALKEEIESQSPVNMELIKLFLKKKVHSLYWELFGAEIKEEKPFDNNSFFGNQENLNLSFEIPKDNQNDENQNHFHIDKDSFASMDSKKVQLDIGEYDLSGSLDEININNLL